MEIQYGLANIDQDCDNREKLKMEDISKMIEEAVKKAVGSQGLKWEDKHQVRNGDGGGQSQGITHTQVGATMSPELVAILLNNQKPKNMEGSNNRVPDMICYQCGGIGHRAGTCTNTPRPQVVNELMTRMGIKQCNDCGRYGYPEVTC